MPALTSARAFQWSAPVLAAGVLAFTLWFHLARPPLPSVAPSARSAPAQRAILSPPALNELPGWSLFGQPAETPSGAAPTADPPAPATLEDLPPTALGLTLSGIAYSPDAAISHAIIGTPDGKQQQVTVGSPLLAGVTVHAIRPLEVIISNQGTLESILLPLESVQSGSAAPPAQYSMPAIPQIPTSPLGSESGPVPAAGPPGT